MCAFLYVALAVGVCALQATAIPAEPVDSLPVQAEEEKPDRTNLPSITLQESTPGMVMRTARMDDREVGQRIVKKLGVGALMVVPVYGLGYILESALYEDREGGDGLGSGIIFEFTVALGYPVAAAIGVSWVDPHDRFILSLAGSAAGFMANFFIPRTKIYQFSAFRWDVVWNWFVCPLVGATIMSEWFRSTPLESQGLSIGLKPDTRGNLSAVASWRF